MKNRHLIDIFMTGAPPPGRALGIDPVRYLDYNGSYQFFQRFDGLSGNSSHLITGPTGASVMDLQIMPLNKSSDPEKELENKGPRSGR
jgi:hypothetical protein